MFGLSMTELVIIALVALLLLGADGMPDAARKLGKGLREFRRATEDLKDQIETEIYADERKQRQPPVSPVPAARPSLPPGAPEPETVPEYLPGAEPPAAAAAPIEPAPAPAPPDDTAQPPRS